MMANRIRRQLEIRLMLLRADVRGLNNPKFIEILAKGLFGDDWDQHSSISEDDMPSQFSINAHNTEQTGGKK